MAFGRVINRPQFEVVFTPEELNYITHIVGVRTSKQDEDEGFDSIASDRLYGQLTELRDELI